MSAVEDKKKKRTKTKRQVTKASQRLTGAVGRSVDIDILTALMVELEKAYNDFCIEDEEYETLVLDEEHEEHRTVNGLDIPAYRANVNEAYTGARDAFVQAKASKISSIAQLDSGPLPADPLAYPLEEGAALPVQGTAQPETTLTSVNLSLVGSLHFPSQGVLQCQLTVLKRAILIVELELVTLQTTLTSVNLSLCSKASNSHSGVGIGYPSDSVPPTPQYPLPQSFTHQPTVTHVYPGQLTSVLPHQPVSYAMPVQSNGTQANVPMGVGSINRNGYSMPPTQQYLLPQPSIQQSTGGQVYPGQLMSVLPYQLGGYGVSAQSYRASSTDTPGVHLKKMSLPTFSGQRKDWPEFKAVWKQLAEGAYKNKTALAHELKRSVKGEASQRIKSVYVTKPEAYDVMWKKLEDYYDDTSATVQAALEDLHKLKPVSETD
ncbi:hypothetical protein OS493_019350 [Desmophyllum pertusum]|uniref:Uncharacterized protein n=1 Tax=Desmophyllum pertusum TaxID=174260 RepID=A0A9X0A1Q9_9CNID|nr:hypothetical protein OS493_019350 [Desmophyllum pertusum]